MLLNRSLKGGVLEFFHGFFDNKTIVNRNATFQTKGMEIAIFADSHWIILPCLPFTCWPHLLNFPAHPANRKFAQWVSVLFGNFFPKRLSILIKELPIGYPTAFGHFTAASYSQLVVPSGRK